VDPLNSQALKAFDSAYDVHHGIDGADFMESHILCGYTVDAAFLFCQQLEGTDGALAYPVGERCVLQRRDEISHVMMQSFGLVRIVRVVRAGSVRVGFGPQRVRMFHLTVRRVDRDLGGYDAATDYSGDFNSGVGEPETSRQRLQPFGCGAGIDEGPEQHVSADSCCRIQDCETTYGHAEISLPVDGRGKSGL
jgi:hypothetical protein